MAILQRLEQRQTQSLTLTPQLREAIKLLELSTVELSAYIEQALQENPLLSVEEYEVETSLEREEEPDPFSEIASADYENVWTHSNDSKPSFGREDMSSFLERISSPPLTLREHLLTQLNTDILDLYERMIGQRLVDCLDEAGYLRNDLTEVGQQLGCSEKEMASVLQKVQQFDPAGVFARDLAECLRLQLRDQQRLSATLEQVLDHLPLLAEGKIDKLCRLTQVTPQILSEALKILRSLDPKPGLRFEASNNVATLIPDVYVSYEVATDEWKVILNEASLPKLMVDRSYSVHFKGSRQGQEPELQKYVQGRLSQAHWLIKALEQRMRTIFAVSTEIVRIQEGFFRKGIKYLKPLALREIAESLGIHESTVSRVTAHKYMATPRGVFEFRYFFSQGLSTLGSGEDVATQAVKHRLRQLVQNENKTKPYSDDDLVALFAQEGTTIARRTIAKYRELLKIPSSYGRRQAYYNKNAGCS